MRKSIYKIAAILLSSSILLSFSGCGKSELDDVVYVDELDQILGDDTWISYENAIRDIQWAIERYGLYHDEMCIEAGSCVPVKFDKDELLDVVEEIVQKVSVEE